MVNEWSVTPFFLFTQDNFRKSFYGLLHIAEVGGEGTVKALESLESRTTGELRPNLFRGAENLVPPDIEKFLPRYLLKWVHKYLALLFVQSKETKSKDLPLQLVKLKKERLLSWHLENPENLKVHESRSVFLIH